MIVAIPVVWFIVTQQVVYISNFKMMQPSILHMLGNVESNDHWDKLLGYYLITTFIFLCILVQPTVVPRILQSQCFGVVTGKIIPQKSRETSFSSCRRLGRRHGKSAFANPVITERTIVRGRVANMALCTSPISAARLWTPLPSCTRAVVTT